MPYRPPLPENLATHPFTLPQARAQGVPRSRGRAKDLWIPSRGIRVPHGRDYTLAESARPYTQLTDSGTVSHVSAALLHGLYLPWRLQQSPVLHLTRPAGAAAVRRKHVHGHRLALAPRDVVLLQGVPVTSLARTLVDLAPLLTVDELVVIIDQLICAHDRPFTAPTVPRLALPELTAYLATCRGQRGLRGLREALLLARVGADSPPETRLRLLISRSPLPEFVPNVQLYDELGRPRVSPDLACPEFRTCLEYDGEHHTTPRQRGKDHDRDFLTAALGWHQVLLNREDLRAGPAVVLTKIARQLRLGGWHDAAGLAGGHLTGRLAHRKDVD